MIRKARNGRYLNAAILTEGIDSINRVYNRPSQLLADASSDD